MQTREKSLLIYITANVTNTHTQHRYKTQHSTVTALHTVNNTVAKGFNQMAPPAWTITVALDWMHTRHKHTTSAWRNTHTSHTRAPTVPRVIIQTKKSITRLTQTYTILQHSKEKQTISLPTATTQQTFPQTPI